MIGTAPAREPDYIVALRETTEAVLMRELPIIKAQLKEEIQADNTAVIAEL